MTHTTRYKKLVNTLKSELRARKWWRALKCLNFAQTQHTGLRKDGITPEFQHQVEIALFGLTMVSLMKWPEEHICTILLHDTREDKNTDWSILRGLITGTMPDIFGEMPDDASFAKRVMFAVKNITKVDNGVKLPMNVYLAQMLNDPISSLDKMLDRDHNLGTMLGVYTIPKLKEQIAESRLILEMGKEAQELFPEQHDAYEIVKKSIKDKIRMIEAYIGMAELSQGAISK